jgi:hypothetical protein
MKNYSNQNEKEVTRITLGQVKQIALMVSQKYEILNRGSYYNIIDKKTRKSSIECGDKNLVSYNMYCIIENAYLKFINENALYFDWKIYGVDFTIERKKYTFKIQDKVIELLSGYK